MYEAAASCKDISRAAVTNWEHLQDTVRRETRDVTMFCYGLAARTEQNNEHTLVRYDVLLQVWMGLEITDQHLDKGLKHNCTDIM